MQISYWWLLGHFLLVLLEDIWEHLLLALINFFYCYKISGVIVCVAKNLYGWIESNTCFMFTFRMYGSFSYKCVVQMWGFNNVMTCYKLI